jgi:hypothetical protein
VRGLARNIFGGNMVEKNVGRESVSMKCSFGWEKLLEMKTNNEEFFAGDGFKRLRIIDVNEKAKSIYFICELGKITFPLKFEKLEEVHKKLLNGGVTLQPYKIDRLLPTWGNFVTGLFRYLGCDKH